MVLKDVTRRAALVHHADHSGVSQTCRVGMMCECSTGELLASAEFMHHDHQGHDALKHFAVHKGLKSILPTQS